MNLGYFKKLEILFLLFIAHSFTFGAFSYGMAKNHSVSPVFPNLIPADEVGSTLAALKMQELLRIENERIEDVLHLNKRQYYELLQIEREAAEILSFFRPGQYKVLFKPGKVSDQPQTLEGHNRNDPYCSICFAAEVNDNAEKLGIIEVNCGGKHAFCTACFVKAYENNQTCPNCRGEIKD